METNRLFMALLPELDGWEMNFAINMSRLTALPLVSVCFSTKPDGF
jgi:hypothetical protein